MCKMSRSEAGRLGAIKTNQLRVARYESQPNFCKNCLKVLLYKQRFNKFCGHSCSASSNNVGVCRNRSGKSGKRGKIEYPDRLKSRIEKVQICCACQTNINNKKIRKYCSLICQRKHEWELRKKQIENDGKENSTRCAKRFLIEVRGRQCEICKITQWQGQLVPLVMDHIDGHSENNKIDNLRLVCGNCDMQLPTYKSKNRGNGRHYRRIRYADKKSY
jgi:hypothetical protein